MRIHTADVYTGPNWTGCSGLTRSDTRSSIGDSPKINVGVHCLKLRTKSMYINPIVDPDEASLYDSYDNSAYWCVSTQTGFGPDGEPVRADLCCLERGCCKL